MTSITFTLADSEVNLVKQTLEQLARRIDQEVILIQSTKLEEQVQETSRLRSLIWSMADSEANHRKQKARLKWLDACSRYDHEVFYKSLRKRGNTRLFQQDGAYQSWKSSNVPCTLLCTGKLGSGKSVMLANIVADLVLGNTDRKYSTAYFFVSDDSESRSARTILGSLLRQALEFIPQGDWTEQLTGLEQRLDFDGLLNIARKALQKDKKI